MLSERASESAPSAGETSLRTMRASKASPASPRPLLPSRSCAAAAASADAGADVDQRKVAGAAAEVADQNQLVVIERGLVGVRRCDRLHLEVDGLESGVKKGLAKPLEREVVVVVGVRADEAHRASDGGVANGLAELLLGAQAKIGEDARDEVFDGVAAAKDLGPGQGAAGQVGLERLNEPSLVLGVEIVLDAGGAGEALDLDSAGVLVLFQIEERAKRLGRARRGREGDQLNRAVGASEGDGAIGRSEVDADRGKVCGRKRHGLSECQIFAL